MHAKIPLINNLDVITYDIEHPTNVTTEYFKLSIKYSLAEIILN